MCRFSDFLAQLSCRRWVWYAKQLQEFCRFLDVVRDRGGAEEGEVFGEAQKAGPRQAIMVLVGGKRAFAGAPGNGDFGIAGFFILAKLPAPIPFALDLVLDPETL